MYEYKDDNNVVDFFFSYHLTLHVVCAISLPDGVSYSQEIFSKQKRTKCTQLTHGDPCQPYATNDSVSPLNQL